MATAAVTACALASAVPASADASPAYLTKTERQRVVDLVRNDDRIDAVLDGASVTVEDVWPWSRDLTRQTIIGGEVTLAFDTPRTVEADWPLLEVEDDGPYTVTTVHYRVENADAIMATVDLDAQRVVGFDVRDGEVDEGSIRYLDAAPTTDRSPADSRPNGSASAAFLAAFLLAGVTAVLVVAASRVSSG
jgi:hypothetical protein